jgi:hypothetical protein
MFDSLLYLLSCTRDNCDWPHLGCRIFGVFPATPSYDGASSPSRIDPPPSDFSTTTLLPDRLCRIDDRCDACSPIITDQLSPISRKGNAPSVTTRWGSEHASCGGSPPTCRVCCPVKITQRKSYRESHRFVDAHALYLPKLFNLIVCGRKIVATRLLPQEGRNNGG